MFAPDSGSEFGEEADVLIFDFIDSVSANLKTYIDSDDLNGALRVCIALINRIASSEVSKWNYRELHFHACTKLELLSNWLYEAHKNGRVGLLEVYEGVQCSDRVVSRLYLMVTVMGVFIKLIGEYGSEDKAIIFACTNSENSQNLSEDNNDSIMRQEKENFKADCVYQEADFNDDNIPLDRIIKYDTLPDEGINSPQTSQPSKKNDPEGYEREFGGLYSNGVKVMQKLDDAQASKKKNLHFNSGCPPPSLNSSHDTESYKCAEEYTAQLSKNFLKSILIDIDNPPFPEIKLTPALLTPESSEYLQGVPNLECLLEDITLMLKGIQAPICGICLRNYYIYTLMPFLKKMNSVCHERVTFYMVRFILNNFIESNILWVRLKHMIEVKGDKRLYRIYKSMHDLIDFNIYALSLVCGNDIVLYKNIILPGLLREIVSCRESYPQKYMTLAIIREFDATFHEATFADLFSGIIQFQDNTKVKKIVIRLFSALQRGELDDSESHGPESVQAASNTGDSYFERVRVPYTPVKNRAFNKPNDELPINMGLHMVKFEKIWLLFTQLVERKHSITMKDISEMTLSLAKFVTRFYPDNAECVCMILEFIYTCITNIIASTEAGSSKNLMQVQSKFCSVLIYLLESNSNYTSMFMPHYVPSFENKIVYNINGKNLAPPYFCKLYLEIADALYKPLYTLLSSKLINACLRMHMEYSFYIYKDEFFTFFLRDQKDLDAVTVTSDSGTALTVNEYNATFSQSREHCKLSTDKYNSSAFAVLLHTVKPQIKTPECFVSFIDDMHLRITERFGESSSYVSGALVYSIIKVIRQYASKSSGNLKDDIHLQEMFRLLYRIIDTMHMSRRTSPSTSNYLSTREINSSEQDDSPAFENKILQIDSDPGNYPVSFEDQCTESICSAALLANSCGVESSTSEFITEALALYEELQFAHTGYKPLSYIIDTLYKIDVLQVDEYHNLATLCALRCSSLYKKRDKCLGLVICSHLFWRQGKFVYEKPQLVVQCLEKALKIAMTIGFKVEGRELLLRVLQEYIWYYRKGVFLITAQRIEIIINQMRDLASSYRPNLYLGRGNFDSESENIIYPEGCADGNIALDPLNNLLEYASSLTQNLAISEPSLSKQIDDESLDDLMGAVANILPKKIASITSQIPRSSPVREVSPVGELNPVADTVYDIPPTTENAVYDSNFEDVHNVWGRGSNHGDSDVW